MYTCTEAWGGGGGSVNFGMNEGFGRELRLGKLLPIPRLVLNNISTKLQHSRNLKSVLIKEKGCFSVWQMDDPMDDRCWNL